MFTYTDTFAHTDTYTYIHVHTHMHVRFIFIHPYLPITHLRPLVPPQLRRGESDGLGESVFHALLVIERRGRRDCFVLLLVWCVLCGGG